MGQNVNYYDHRRVFNDAADAMIKAGVNPSTAVLSQSYLRLEVVASTTVTRYQWGVLVNDQPNGQQVRPTERRLALQDAFYVGQIGFYLGLAGAATDTNFPLFAWNNPTTFSTANAATGLNNLYNGYLSLVVNNRVIIPAWDLFRHKNIPITQLTGAANTPQDALSGGLDATFPAEPNCVLIGSKNNELTATLPAAITALQAASTTVLVLIMRGVLAQNVTVVS